MNLDPYAAPRADYVPPPPPMGGGGGPWEIGETLSAAWRAFVSAWGPLVFAFLFVGIVFAVPLGITVGIFIAPHLGSSPGELKAAMEDPDLYAAMLGWNVVNILAYSFFQVGIVRMRLCAVRGQPVSFGDLFSGGSRFGAMLGLQAILAAPGLLSTTLGLIARYGGLVVLVPISNMLGNLIFVAMMILQALGLVLSEYYVVDRNEGPVAAIRSSLSAPSGERGRVFGYLLVTGLVAVAGFFCCGLPAIVTMPYSGVCAAMLYTRLVPRP